ncbi:DNA-binding protein [Candidatus Desantisbacteria bacterium CG_4_9_14_3_um_filter_40_11]|uniref:DNA-binding protein n=4 Tax=unclassified Candidatus Desantisiibacteriota TaxID=3106372 RepID=A0A2M7JCJ6_9BACT|nr:MAG: DNA-binding protein [Candidatus Desantisbacteria bacterium CG23_combo_of_CG06-09_8_20_14_all_40_23]PIX17139.1 MAG: DNA-binding protein [Candidatus Desantisbacteria bacterium CG_4_8_14_3_um_filter_40_12]PIY20060.1 MAG: DNA-binding protein [Candidatus Desantisbacteria bacterium CG_4_10_14_3_um_filter_40_18]PJB29305.1 MAG: DNA-binding protein [Candidatus Desantisbacteria bacterium CG_4_9_14_3_um_filter_40_11]
MNEHELINVESIQNCIYTIRGVQVMIDRDLSELYEVETKVLNQAVKRNSERFPEEFMFQITDDEFNRLRSQFVTLNQRGGRRYLPYAFTEQGVAMLSAVLRSETAVKISVQIIKAFVSIRRFILSNAQVFQRLDTLEIKQINTDKKIDKVLNAIESKEIQPKQGIFFDGQIFDAWQFVSDLIRSASKSIILIDNYVDDSVLALLAKRKKGVSVTILTKKISRQLEADVEKFNEQYPAVAIKKFTASHDRFMIIDDTTLYHFGASLKDLGKKWFAFSKMDSGAIEMLARLKVKE